ncbi:hypothetical protein L218DRAFT_991090 [Marasmius fiardii PR-910]|nr:hypothetical protein L218DRAFT_991090 [Marasmius fiardii PR-910]
MSKAPDQLPHLIPEIRRKIISYLSPLLRRRNDASLSQPTMLKKTANSGYLITSSSPPTTSKDTEQTYRLLPEIERKIVSYLSPLDLMNYALINKKAHTVVKDLQLAAFRVERILSPFFSPDEIVRFRQVQLAYKFLISGTTALSFFTREIFENADLNIYIWPNYVIILALLLQSMGYTFIPINRGRKKQSSEVQDAVEDMLFDLHSEDGSHEIWDGSNDEPYVSQTNLVEVFNFDRNEKKIQLIAGFSPLTAVLQLHSTADMNIISHSHAISFYPRLTFHDRIAVANFLGRAAPPSHDIITTYENRGYTFRVHIDAVTALAGRYSALDANIMRRPGDIYCWTVPLESIPNVSGLDFKSELLFEESWEAAFETVGRPDTPGRELMMTTAIAQNLFEWPISSGYCYASSRLADYLPPKAWVEAEPMSAESYHRNLLLRLAFANHNAKQDLKNVDRSLEEITASFFKKVADIYGVPHEKFPCISHVRRIPWLIKAIREKVGREHKLNFHFNYSQHTTLVSLEIELIFPSKSYDMIGNAMFPMTVVDCLADLIDGRILIKFVRMLDWSGIAMGYRDSLRQTR